MLGDNKTMVSARMRGTQKSCLIFVGCDLSITHAAQTVTRTHAREHACTRTQTTNTENEQQQS